MSTHILHILQKLDSLVNQSPEASPPETILFIMRWKMYHKRLWSVEILYQARIENGQHLPTSLSSAQSTLLDMSCLHTYLCRAFYFSAFCHHTQHCEHIGENMGSGVLNKDTSICAVELLESVTWFYSLRVWSLWSWSNHWMFLEFREGRGANLYLLENISLINISIFLIFRQYYLLSLSTVMSRNT